MRKNGFWLITTHHSNNKKEKSGSFDMEQDRLLRKPTAYAIFLAMGFLFVFFWLTGRELAAEGNILWTGGYVFRTLLSSLLAGGVLGIGLCAVFYLLAAGGKPFGRKILPKEEDKEVGAPFFCRDSRNKTESSNRQADYGKGETLNRQADYGKGETLNRQADYGKSEAARQQTCSGKGGAARRQNIWGNIKVKRQSVTGGVVFWGSFLLLALGWLPGYLAYYPAICSYDCPTQIGQIAENSYIDHHPIAHTLLIKGAMSFGENVFGSTNRGIGFYALVQLLLLAAVFAFGIWRIYKRGVKLPWLAVLLMSAILFPFNSYMGITVTKDTIFSVFFLFLLLSMYELIYKSGEEKKVTWKELLFLGSAVCMILFRTNGKYAFLVFLTFSALTTLFGKSDRKRFGRIFLLAAAGFLAGNIALAVVFRATDAQQGDKREMLSMPIQQLSRCMLYHGGAGILPEDDNTMEESEKALIQDFILDEGYKEYDPVISDPVKRHTNTYVVRYRLKEFVSVYLSLLARYPGDFLNAALAVDAGYLYPGDMTHASVNMKEDISGMGYVQTHWNEEVFANYGIYKDSKWDWLHGRMERWADENGYLKIPVLRYLFMPGIWIWLYMALFGWLAIKREFAKCLPLALILGYYCTLLLGPTVQLRYIYPVMIAFPFTVFSGIGYRDGESL
jgi:hypothetical protein